MWSWVQRCNHSRGRESLQETRLHPRLPKLQSCLQIPDSRLSLGVWSTVYSHHVRVHPRSPFNKKLHCSFDTFRTEKRQLSSSLFLKSQTVYGHLEVMVQLEVNWPLKGQMLARLLLQLASRSQQRGTVNFIPLSSSVSQCFLWPLQLYNLTFFSVSDSFKWIYQNT